MPLQTINTVTPQILMPLKVCSVTHSSLTRLEWLKLLLKGRTNHSVWSVYHILGCVSWIDEEFWWYVNEKYWMAVWKVCEGWYKAEVLRAKKFRGNKHQEKSGIGLFLSLSTKNVLATQRIGQNPFSWSQTWCLMISAAALLSYRDGLNGLLEEKVVTKKLEMMQKCTCNERGV